MVLPTISLAHRNNTADSPPVSIFTNPRLLLAKFSQQWRDIVSSSCYALRGYSMDIVRKLATEMPFRLVIYKENFGGIGKDGKIIGACPAAS
jgi:hypothetical protein